MTTPSGACKDVDDDSRGRRKAPERDLQRGVFEVDAFAPARLSCAPMRSRTLSPRRAALGLVLAAAMALHVGPVVAAPDDSEPLMQLLAGNGLLPSPIAPPAPAVASDAAAPAADAPGLVRRAHDRASDMVISAMNFIGVRYRRGGNSAETGFDCSGFTRHVFEASLGLVLPRRADEQATMPGLVKVERSELRPGDLVFFNTLRRTFSHVGIYVGDNRFVHAPSHGKDVRTDDMTLAYWARRFTGARRAEAPAASQAALASADAPATR
jgi:cell wall-associated NlpC family hydrolase